MNAATSGSNVQDRVIKTIPKQVTQMNPRGYTINPPALDRPVRVYVHGVFDLFHVGHSRFLKQVKTLLPNTTLIVGVTEDLDTLKAKGLTVMTGAERSEVVRECRWVDEVIEDCPPVLLPEFFGEYQIDYFAHDDDYVMPEGVEDPYEFVKRSGKFVVVPRTKNISTTEVITRILRQRKEFVTRQKRHGVILGEMDATDLS